MARARYFAVFALVIGCSSANGATDPAEPFDPLTSQLKNCNGKASSTIPSDGVYVLTTFGGPGESQQMSCGQSTSDGSWYYAASRQRYGCGSKIQISANGNCVVAETDDYGPDVCVENAAGLPIIDASPMVAQALFGTSGAGWSDNLQINVTQVDGSTPLGPCNGQDPSKGAGGSSGCDPNTDPNCSSGSGGGSGSGGSGSCDPWTDPNCGVGGSGGSGGCDPWTDPNCGVGGGGGSGGCDPWTDPNCGAGGGGGSAGCDPWTDPNCGGGVGGSFSGTCGDGYCDVDEDCYSCPDDCWDPYC